MYRRALLLGTCVLPALAACASVNTQQTTTVNAVVETVDPVSRELLLRGDGGSQSGALLSMVVGSHVERLNEIHPGDRVRVTYYQALAAKVVSPLAGSNQAFAGVAVDRNDTAERPGGEVTRVRSGRVTITAVDPTSGVLYVNSNEIASVFALTENKPTDGTGERTYRNQCALCHGKDRAGSPPTIPC